MAAAFSVIDYIIMGVYLSGLLILGIYLQRKSSKNIQEYFLGGNKLPWWALGISGMASHMDMTGTMIIVSLIYMFGFRGMFIEIRGGLILLMAFAMVFHGKWNRRSNCMTVAEWMEYRFGRCAAGEFARFLQAIAVLIMTIGMLGMFVKGSGLFLSLFLPYSPFTCSLILFAVATVYTIVSGFYGVVFTDIFQSLFILVAVVTVSIMAFTKISDAQSFADMAARVTGNQDWMSISVPSHVEMPEAYSTFDKFAGAIFFYIVLTTLIGMSRSGGRPMYFGARSERECGKLSFVWILTSAIRWPLMAGLVILGLYFVNSNFSDTESVAQAAELVKQHVPDIPEHTWGQTTTAIINTPQEFSPDLIRGLEESLGANWRAKLRIVGYYGTINPEQILPAVILYMFPIGLKGIVFVALIAAAMSTFDTYVNQTAAYFVRDIYQRYLRPKALTRELIWISYGTCLVIIVAGATLGFYARNVNEIWDWVMVGVSGGMALPGLLRWYWARFNGFGYAGGVFFGMVAAWMQRWLFPEFAEPWIRLPMILGISLLGCLVGTYLTRPTDNGVLRNFYRTTKPFGFWKRFRDELDEQTLREYRQEHRSDIISLFIAVPWQFMLYWTPMQLMFHQYVRFWVSLLILAILSVALYWFWYRNLPVEKRLEAVHSLSMNEDKT